MAGGLTVGAVSIKVRPDMDGFRSKVESDIRSLRDVRLKVTPTGLAEFRQRVEAELKTLRPVRVKVVPDVDGFHSRVEQTLASLDKAAEVDVDFDLDVARLIAEAESITRAAASSIPVSFNVDQVGFRERVRAMVASARDKVYVQAVLDRTPFLRTFNKLRNHRRNFIEARMEMNPKGFYASLAKLKAKAKAEVREFADATVTIHTVIKGGLRAAWERQKATLDRKIEANAHLDGKRFRKDVVLLRRHAMTALGRIGASLHIRNAGAFIGAVKATAAAAGRVAKVPVRLNLRRGALRRLTSSISRGAGVLARPFTNMFGGQFFTHMLTHFTQMKGMIALVTIAVSALGVALAPIAGFIWQAVTAATALAAAMAPAMIVGAALAVGAFVKAFQGFGDVFKANSLDELNAAMSNLGPNAQLGARGIYDIKQAFSEASAGAQEVFWAGIGDGLSNLTSHAGVAGDAVKVLSESFGQAIGRATEFLATSEGITMFNQLIHKATDATAELFDWFANSIPGITAVGAVGAEMFSRWVDGAGKAADAWSNKMVAAFNDGSLQASMDAKAQFLQQFIEKVGQIGDIVGAIFGSMSRAGMQFMGPLGEIVAKTSEWVQTAEGVSALDGFFKSIAAIVKVIVPLFGEIANAIVTTVIPAISSMITAMEPGLKAFADGLTQALEIIAPMLEPIGAAFGKVLQFLAPLLPAIAPLVPAIAAVAVAFGAVSKVIAVLSPVFSVLSAVIGGLSWPIVAVVAVIVGLVAAFTQSEEAMAGLKQAFEQIKAALQPLGALVVQLGQALISALMPVFVALVPVISAFISVVVSIVQALAPVLAIVLQVGIAFVQLVGVILGFVATVLGAILGFVASVIAGFASMVATVISVVAGWVSSVVGAVAGFVDSVTNWFQNMWIRVVAAFTAGTVKAINIVSQMPGKAKAGLGNVGSVLVESGKALIRGFINGIKAMIGAVVDAAKSVVSAARDFFPFSPAKKGPFSGRGYTTYSGRALVNDFAAGIRSAAGNPVAAVKNMMGSVNEGFESFHRNKILEPVLENNAKKVADWRKKVAEEEEKSAKKIADIRASDAEAAEKDKQIAEERARLAEDLRKSREDMESSLEAPDYSKIDRSFKAYYVEGAREMLTKSLKEAVGANAGAIKTSVQEAAKVLVHQMGVSQAAPLLDLDVNAPYLEQAINSVIEDSKFSEIPIDFAASNVDQFLSDIGFGDGAIGRAVQQAMEFDVNKSDANRFGGQDSKTEVHYHVQDMNEAIRLEQLRERKQMMKVR